MNKTIETILQHRSIRKFTSEKVSKEDLDLILRCACNGSTMGNMQLFSIIVTTDKQMMEKAAPLHFNQPIATNHKRILFYTKEIKRKTYRIGCRKLVII